MKAALQRLIVLGAVWMICVPMGLADSNASGRAAANGSSRSESARGAERTGKRPGRTPKTEELSELVRRAQETAEEAREEARRVRKDYEALLQRFEELTLSINSKLNAAEMERNGTSATVSAHPAGESAPSAQGRPPGDRITRAEEQVEINTAQIKEQAQTKVESESRFNVRLSGMILFNTFYNGDGIQRVEPAVALERPPGSTSGTFGSTLRQTRLGLAISGPRVAGARLSAEIDFDFYGGTVGQFEGDVLGALRIRTAAARLDWERTSLSVGQEAPIISPRNPTSLAAVWFPALSSAGNLWQWRPRATIEHRFKAGSSQVIAQASVEPPFGESYAGYPLSGVPAYEGRVAWHRALDTDRAVEFGVGGRYGRRDLLYDRKLSDYIVTGDWVVPIGTRLELSGEFYYGRAVGLGEQGGSRIDRLYAFSGPIENPATLIRGIRSSGGWAQMTVTARSDLEFNFAYGQQDPNNSDVRFGFGGAANRYKNQVGSANFIYQVRPTFLVSLEYRRLLTDYISGRKTTNHYNLAVAYVF